MGLTRIESNQNHDFGQKSFEMNRKTKSEIKTSLSNSKLTIMQLMVDF